MEKNDAPAAKSGISKELFKEIDAQYAIIDSAVRLINQLRQDTNNKPESNKNVGEWAYNMKDLAYWIHHYTERRRLICPHCKHPSRVKCKNCGEEYEYHDEL